MEALDFLQENVSLLYSLWHAYKHFRLPFPFHILIKLMYRCQGHLSMLFKLLMSVVLQELLAVTVNYSIRKYVYCVCIYIHTHAHYMYSHHFVLIVIVEFCVPVPQLKQEESLWLIMLSSIRYSDCFFTDDVQVLVVFLSKQQERIRKLISSGRYDQSNNFTVVLQPFMEGIEVPMKVCMYVCARARERDPI